MDEDEKPETTEDESTEQPEDSAETAEQPEDSAETAEQPSEFAALSDLLAKVLQGIADIRADMANAIQVSNAMAVDNGASIVDSGVGDADVEIVDEMPVQPEDRDYSL